MNIYKPPKSEPKEGKIAPLPLIANIVAIPIIYYLVRFILYVVEPNLVKLLMGRKVNSFTTYELDLTFLVLDEIFSLLTYILIFAGVKIFARLKSFYVLFIVCVANSVYTFNNNVWPEGFGADDFPAWYDMGMVFNCWIAYLIVVMAYYFKGTKKSKDLEQNV